MERTIERNKGREGEKEMLKGGNVKTKTFPVSLSKHTHTHTSKARSTHADTHLPSTSHTHRLLEAPVVAQAFVRQAEQYRVHVGNMFHCTHNYSHVKAHTISALCVYGMWLCVCVYVCVFVCSSVQTCVCVCVCLLCVCVCV